MLSITKLSYHLGQRMLYDNANLHVNSQDRIGLIGDNGAGKSTLFQLIMGKISPDKGTIHRGKGYTIGWLHQDLISYESQGTIRQVAMEGMHEICQLQRKMDELTKEMELNYQPALLEELVTLQDLFGKLGGYKVEGRVEKMLLGLGFASKDIDRPFLEFSGGWRMRVLLAKLLLQTPDLLLLDEPTNHLDIETIKWLEQYLKSYPKELMLISHDRCLLDTVTNKTVEVKDGQLTIYAGNYTFAENARQAQQEIEANAYKNQQREIKHTEQFIDRFRYKASKARQVQSRIKSLERMDKVEAVVDKKQAVNMRFDMPQKPGKVLLDLDKVGKAYGSNLIFTEATASVERGDKIGLVGANGKGKSTLLRMLVQEEKPDTGTIGLGHQVVIGYYAQHQLDMLTPSRTIIEELRAAAPDEEESTLRTILGNFLFRKDDVYKKIHVLSGGEKARVALAKILLKKANCLVLDEPTNHLDMASKAVLIQALQQFAGTLVMVSHDRHFIRQIANKIWHIESHKLKVYPGNYDEYTYAQQAAGA